MAARPPPPLHEPATAELEPPANVTLAYLQGMRREMQAIREQHARVLELFQRQQVLVQSFGDEATHAFAELKADIAYLEIQNTGRHGDILNLMHKTAAMPADPDVAGADEDS